ncbi:hypothetical protein [Mycolicibacterium thermoresistibile]
MRRRQPRWVLVSLAISWIALLVSGCSAQAGGVPPAAEPPQATVTPSPQAPLPPPPEAPIEGLDTRVQKAVADAAASGADVEVAVLDRTTGLVVSGGAGKSFPIASVVKLFIADDLLLQVAEGQAELSDAERQSLDAMLSASEDGAAQIFWERGGQNAVISRIVARYGLTGTAAPYNGKWDVTTSTAGDLVRYYDMLLDGTGGLPAEQADIIVGNLADFTSAGADGYPQRFGIPDGLPGERVAVKQGWFCCWNRGNELHVSTGILGSDRRYVMAISSLQPTDAATARETITQTVRTIFPGGTL